MVLKYEIVTHNLGRYKQWNGLLKWKTGLGYWTKLFSFFGQVYVFIFRRSLTYLINKWMATMDNCNNDDGCLLQ